MFKSVKEWLIQKILVDFLIGWIEDGLAKISDMFGVNGRKTTISIAVMVLGAVLVLFPDGTLAEMLRPILEYLSDQPHDVLISESGEVMAAAGAFGWAVDRDWETYQIF